MRDRLVNNGHRRDGAAPAGGGGPRRATSTPGVGNQQMLRALGIQAKSVVSQPSDPDEIDADRLADDFVHRQVKSCPCDGNPGDEPRLMRKASGAGPAASSRVVSGEGRPLRPSLRRPFERFYGADLGHVRIHADGSARPSADSLQARAYTHGHDIVFAPGEFAPHTGPGDRLLAHELAHVVQQQRAPRPNRIARQSHPVNPVLTPEEMFGIVTRERSWSFNPGGASVCEDPAGVGRGVGAAAGGRRAGSSVFAVIQVTDAEGRPVALSYGEHISYGDPHAEQRAVTALRREIPVVRDVSGGRMTVVLDQTPCPPGRQNCMGLLQGFARERGLNLEVHLPTRERMSGGGAVRPRTAAMSSMRTDVPEVSLQRYYPPGTTPPGGAGPGAGGPGGTGPGGSGARVAPVARGTGPVRLVPPAVASPSAARAQASAILALEQETQRSVRLTARIRLIARGVTGLLSILGTIAMIRTFQQMAAHGTIFPDAERQADQIGRYGSELEQWAIDTTNNISLLSILASITDATDRDDSSALFDIDNSLTDIYLQFSDRADTIGTFARNLRLREQALDVMVDFYRTMVSVPQGPSTAPNAEAFAMYQSLERLSGRVGSAAGHYEAAERQLRFYADTLQGYATAANRRAWAIVLTRIGVAIAEARRERELDESIRRERRLNEIHRELLEIDAELNAPVCRPPDDTIVLRMRRDFLVRERETLRAAASG